MMQTPTHTKNLMDNPNLNLEILNDIESRISNQLETVADYEIIDQFILFAFRRDNYLNNLMKEVGFKDYSEFIIERRKPSSTFFINVSRIEGAISAILTNLKSFAITNNLF